VIGMVLPYHTCAQKTRANYLYATALSEA
jgi:hypothetical protein